MKNELGDNPSLSDYSLSEDEALEEYAEFSPKYQAFRLFRACLSLQAQGQYPRARKTFYDNLGWFTVMFDATFPRRCQNIINRYNTKFYEDAYTFEQIEQLKYMRIVVEFSRMLIDASSKNRVKFNINPNKRVELTPVGYAQVLNYEHMSVEFFNKLTQIQQQQSHKDAVKFFNHSIAWFGGIFDAKFMMQGYLIDQTEANAEIRYRKLVSAFSKLLTRKSITPTAFATLVYKPRPNDNTPRTVDDIMNAKKKKEAGTDSFKDISHPAIPLQPGQPGEALSMQPVDIPLNVANMLNISDSDRAKYVMLASETQEQDENNDNTDISSSDAPDEDILDSDESKYVAPYIKLWKQTEDGDNMDISSSAIPAKDILDSGVDEKQLPNPNKQDIALTVEELWEIEERKMKERARRALGE